MIFWATRFLLAYATFSLIYSAVWFFAQMVLKKALNIRPSEARKFSKEDLTASQNSFLSVIVPCRNEEKRLLPLLESLEKQSHPTQCWEVIFVDDESEDNTAKFIQSWIDSQEHIQSKLISLNNKNEHKSASKKAALTAGISASQYPYILSTDADCEPNAGWLQSIADHITNDHASQAMDLLIGPVGYQSSGSLMHELQRAESAGLVALGLAAAEIGQPFLANGANLCFRRSAFEAIGGYGSHKHLASGDDVFLLKSFQKAGCRIATNLRPEAVVITAPPDNWAAYWQQNVRWLSKSRVPNGALQAVLQVLGFVVWAGWVPAVVVLLLVISFSAQSDSTFNSTLMYVYTAIAVVLRMLADLGLLLPMYRLFGFRFRFWPWLLSQPVYSLWVLALGFRLFLGSKKYEWKGRRTQ